MAYLKDKFQQQGYLTRDQLKEYTEKEVVEERIYRGEKEMLLDEIEKLQQQAVVMKIWD